MEGLRPTKFANRLAIFALALYAMAIIATTVAPAALATAICAYLVFSRQAAQSQFSNITIRVRRQLPTLQAQELGQVKFDARPSSIPQGVTVRFKEQLPSKFGASNESLGLIDNYDIRVRDAGHFKIGPTTLQARDRRGLWYFEETLHNQESIHIHATSDAADEGRAMARRTGLELLRQDRRGLLTRNREFESLRPFQPGDSLRDVDWKRLSQGLGTLSREWEKEAESTIAFLIDASRTMRARHNVSKLEHAMRITVQMAELAVQRRYRIAAVFFDETGIQAEILPARGRKQIAKMQDAFEKLPQIHDVVRRLNVTQVGEMTAKEEAFLSKVREIHDAEPGMPAEAAAKRLLSRKEQLHVFALTDLEAMPDQLTRALWRLQKGRNEVTAIILPGSRFMVQGDLGVYELEQAYLEQKARREGRGALLKRGIRTMELGPEEMAMSVVKATQEKR